MSFTDPRGLELGSSGLYCFEVPFGNSYREELELDFGTL